ncbi:MAG TPA: TIGR00268 family protein, partial [Desulfobacterales bacterium]|nr:TIGR00268 family protein [Desulfobacterales bacterium]
MSAFHDPDAGLLDALRQWFRRVGAMAVAWSGGADSTLLTAVGGEELGDQLLALHVHTPLHTKEERR